MHGVFYWVLKLLSSSTVISSLRISSLVSHRLILLQPIFRRIESKRTSTVLDGKGDCKGTLFGARRGEPPMTLPFSRRLRFGHFKPSSCRPFGCFSPWDYDGQRNDAGYVCLSPLHPRHGKSYCALQRLEPGYISRRRFSLVNAVRGTIPRPTCTVSGYAYPTLLLLLVNYEANEPDLERVLDCFLRDELLFRHRR